MHIPWIFLSISGILTFLVLLFLARWIGSTQLTQLTFFNWVAGASMGNIAANMIAANNVHDWVAACYELTIFTAASVLAAWIALKNREFRRVANGEPTVLIHKGVILRKNLRQTKVNMDVLLMLLREKGYFSYGDIEYAILEPTGNLSILPSQESQSASKEDLVRGPDLSPRGQGPYIEIVIDGEVDRDKLRDTGYDDSWLNEQVQKFGVKSVAELTFLGVNAEGEVIADTHRRDSDDENPLV